MNQKPNISILITSFTSGGAEKVISLLLKKMVQDFNVKLVLFYNEIHFSIPAQVETIILSKKNPTQSLFKKLGDLVRFQRAYKKVLKDHEIQYSLSFLAFPNLINGLLSTKHRAFKTLLSERGFPSDNTTSKASYLISKLFYPWLYNKSDRLFSNSTFINQDLEKNFDVKIPMAVIYNPIEIPNDTILPSKLAEKLNILKVITVGSVDKRKNQIMVIKAIHALNDPSIRFDIYGAGPLETYIGHQIEELGLSEQVFLRGRTKDVNNKLLDAHVFVLSSFTEGFPNALLEAMAIGLPCISTNCLSGPLEMLNNGKNITIEIGEFAKVEYGILINNDDAVALAKAIKYLSDHPQEREKFSQRSLERSREYELDVVYSQFRGFVLK